MQLKVGIKNITMYGADWCGDCKRAEMFFEEHSIDYLYIDIDNDESASQKVIEINSGNRSIPTIIIKFEDQKNIILVEPSWEELSEALLRP